MSIAASNTNLLTKNVATKHKEPKIGLPNRVAQWYYKHGLFLSSYPTCALSIAIFVILFSW